MLSFLATVAVELTSPPSNTIAPAAHPAALNDPTLASFTSSSPSLLEHGVFSFVPGLSTNSEYSWLFGVFLAAMASIISNLGLTLQKLTHQRISSGYGSTRPYYQHALWIIGLLLVMFASVADVIALCFAPQSLIAPLGALTMVSNVVFAPLLLHEKIGVRDLIATSVILTGSVIAVIFGAHADRIFAIEALFGLFHAPRFVAYASCVIVGLLAFLFMLHQFSVAEEAHLNGQGPGLTETQRHWQRFAYPAIAGTVGAQSVLFAKCAVELIINTARHQGSMFVHYQSYLIVACMFGTIFLQIKWLNDGLIRFDTSYIVPVFVSFWIVLSVMSGMIFFKEHESMSWTQIWLFMLGVMCTVAGVILLSFRPIVAVQSRGTSAFDAFDSHSPRPRSRRASLDGLGSPFSPAVSTDREHLGLPNPPAHVGCTHDGLDGNGVGGGLVGADGVAHRRGKNTLAVPGSDNASVGVPHSSSSSRSVSPRDRVSVPISMPISARSASSAIDSTSEEPSASVRREEEEEDEADRSDEEREKLIRR